MGLETSRQRLVGVNTFARHDKTNAARNGSCMYIRRTRSSGRILEFGFFDDLVPEIPAEVLSGAQIDGRSVQKL